MDKMREEFERWIDGLSYSELDDFCALSAWKAWQASRAAVVVELHATCYRAEHVDDCSNGLEWDNYYEIDEVKSALSEAGIKCT